MKWPPNSLWIFVLGGILCLSGCGHLDLTPEGSPSRVVTGTVNVRMNLIPPPDSEVIVRLVEPSAITSAPTGPTDDMVIAERGTRSRPERILAEQVIHSPGPLPAPFRIEYRADDDMLRRGLNIEARISWGGRVRFRTLDAQLVTLRNADVPQKIWVEPIE